MSRRRTPQRARGAARPSSSASSSPASSWQDCYSSQQGPEPVGAADNTGFFVSVVMDMVVLISSVVKEAIAYVLQRPSLVLLCMGLAGVFGSLLWVQKLGTKDVPQVLPEQSADDLRNALVVWGQLMKEIQRLRDEVARLMAAVTAMRKDRHIWYIQETVPAAARTSDWVLNRPGTAIDLQRSSTSWICRTLWLLHAPALLDTFVQPDASPGHCWPFQGAQSELLVRLPSKIHVKAVILQHSPNRASPMETISSAPRDFTVSGLDEEGREETLLGTFTYEVRKEPTQTFLLQKGSCKTFHTLKLVIWSSWGQTGHACIYRVKVQGKIAGTNSRSIQLPSLPSN